MYLPLPLFLCKVQVIPQTMLGLSKELVYEVLRIGPGNRATLCFISNLYVAF